MVAPTTNILIAARVVMGIGAAASEPGTLLDGSATSTPVRANGRGPLASGPPWPRVGPGPAHRRPSRLRLVLAGHLLVQRVLRRAGASPVPLIVTRPRARTPVRARFDIPGFCSGPSALGSLHLRRSSWERRPGIERGGSTCSSSSRSWPRPSPSFSPSCGPWNPVLNVRYFKTRRLLPRRTSSPLPVYFGTFAIFFMVASGTSGGG